MKNLHSATRWILCIVIAIFLCSCAAVVTETAKGGASAVKKSKYKDKAMAGDPEDQFQLAESYCCGFGKLYNNNEAYRWYCESAKQGHLEALYKLGVFFSGGEGFAAPATKLRRAATMPKDNAIRFAFFSMAAKKGHEEAFSKAQELNKSLTMDERVQSDIIIQNFPLMSCDLDRVLTENGIE